MRRGKSNKTYGSVRTRAQSPRARGLSVPAVGWAERNGLYLTCDDGVWGWWCKRSGKRLVTWNPSSGVWTCGVDEGWATDWRDVGRISWFVRDQMRKQAQGGDTCKTVPSEERGTNSTNS